MRRLLVAVAVCAASVVGLTGSAYADTMTPCDVAKAQTAQAQVNYTAALNVLIARAKELGFSAENISAAETILNQSGGHLTAADEKQLMAMYQQHSQGVNLLTDLPKVKAVLDTRLALDAAIAAQNIECAPAPVASTAPQVTPAPATPTLPPRTVTVMPKGAPATGDGSLAGR